MSNLHFVTIHSSQLEVIDVSVHLRESVYEYKQKYLKKINLDVHSIY